MYGFRMLCEAEIRQTLTTPWLFIRLGEDVREREAYFGSLRLFCVCVSYDVEDVKMLNIFAILETGEHLYSFRFSATSIYGTFLVVTNEHKHISTYKLCEVNQVSVVLVNFEIQATQHKYG